MSGYEISALILSVTFSLTCTILSLKSITASVWEIRESSKLSSKMRSEVRVLIQDEMVRNRR